MQEDITVISDFDIRTQKFVFEKVEFKFQNNSTLRELLPLWSIGTQTRFEKLIS